MPYRVVFQFNHPRGGWSETFYTNAGSLNIALAEADALASARGSILVPSAEMVAYRVADVDNLRSSVLFKPIYTPWPDSAEGCDAPWTGALYGVYATPTSVSRRLLLRGVPDELFTQRPPIGDVIAQKWRQDAINLFFAVLYNPANNWSIRRFDVSAQPGAFISSLTNTVGVSSITVRPNSVPPVLVGQYVQVYGVRGVCPPLARSKVLSTNTPNDTFTIPGTLPVDYTYPGGARFVRLGFVYSQITQVQFERVSTRKIGRPFGLIRGRRRACRRSLH